MKITLLALMCMVITSTAYATNNLHRFQVSNAAYAELTGARDVTKVIVDSGFVMIDELAGEEIFLMNRNWQFDNIMHYITVHENGRIIISGDTVFALFDVLYTDSVSLIDQTSGISYKIEGDESDRILKLQWKNIRIDPGPEGNYFNAQMWVYLNTGLVEYRYGPRSANNADGYIDKLKGIYIGIWHSDYPDFSKGYEKIQITGTPPDILVDSVINMNVPNILGVPAEGTMYSFIPKTIPLRLSEASANDVVRIYPNPVGDVLCISTQGSGLKGAINIYNASARLVHSMQVRSGRHTVIVPFGNFPAGNYFLEYSNGKGEITRQIIIHR